MRYAAPCISLPCPHGFDLAFEVCQDTSELVPCFETMLQWTRLSLERASTHTSDRGRTVRQRHYSVRVAATALDLCEVSKKVTTSLLGTVVLFIGERSISKCDQTYLIPFEMSAWKAKPYLITFVSKLYDCVCVAQSAGIRQFQRTKFQEQIRFKFLRFQSLDLTRTRRQVVTCSATNVNWQRYRAVQRGSFC